MKKIKFLIASMIGAIALVFACVLGTKVNAADAVTTGNHTWYADSNWSTGTKGSADKINDIFSGVAGATAQRNAFGSLVSSGLNNEFSGTKTWNYELRIYSYTGTFAVTIGDNQVADYELYAYTSKDANKRSITIGSNVHSLKSKTIEKFEGTIDGGTTNIVCSGDQVCLLEATFNVTNATSTKVMESISLTNTKKYYTNDTVSLDDFTIVANYDDESTKTLTSSACSLSIIDSDNKVVENNKVTTSGNYIATISVDGTDISNTFEITVFEAQIGEGKIFNPSNLVAENFGSSRIIDGTIFTILSTDSSKVRIDANNKSIDGFNFTKRLVFGGKAATTTCALKVNAPSAGTIKVYGMSNSSNSTRILGLFTSKLEAIDNTSFSNDGNAIAKHEFEIDNAGEYLLGAVASGFSIYYVEFIPAAQIADDVTLAFGHQFDAATEAESTKLRFIGKIDGIAYDSTTDISSVVFSFTFNDKARTANCYKLYKGITSLDGTATKSDTTLYVVYSLNNINKAAYSGEALTNIKLTVTFSDGSTKEVSHDSITLPNFE